LTFLSVSFGSPSRKLVESTTVGGLPVAAMKKLNGARFPTSSIETVETQPIGRGTTELISIR
jgi:hypothetical protein